MKHVHPLHTTSRRATTPPPTPVIRKEKEKCRGASGEGGGSKTSRAERKIERRREGEGERGGREREREAKRRRERSTGRTEKNGEGVVAVGGGQYRFPAEGGIFAAEGRFTGAGAERPGRADPVAPAPGCWRPLLAAVRPLPASRGCSGPETVPPSAPRMKGQRGGGQ